MYRDDYLLRLIREFAQLITYVLGLNRQRQHAQALAAIEAAYKDLLNLDPLLVRSLAAPALVDILGLADHDLLARDHCLFLAALQQAEAQTHAAQGDESRGYAASLKALEITLHTLRRWPATDLPPYAPAPAHLHAALVDFVLPASCGLLLLAHYEAEQQFARAEDLIFAALADPEQAPAWQQAGIAFYQRLLALPDAALAAGGLPRGEVQAGLAELQALPV